MLSTQPRKLSGLHSSFRTSLHPPLPSNSCPSWIYLARHSWNSPESKGNGSSPGVCPWSDPTPWVGSSTARVWFRQWFVPKNVNLCPKVPICAPKCPSDPISPGISGNPDPCRKSNGTGSLLPAVLSDFFFFPHPKSPERLWEPGGEMSQIPCAGGQGDLPGPSCSAPGAILTNLHLLKSGHIPKMGKSTKLQVHRAGPLSMGRLWW